MGKLLNYELNIIRWRYLRACGQIQKLEEEIASPSLKNRWRTDSMRWEIQRLEAEIEQLKARLEQKGGE